MPTQTRQAPTATSLDLLTEDLYSFSEAAKELPNRPAASTVWRWHKRGLGGTKLQAVKIGSQLFTSRQAVTRFLRAINS